MRKLFSLILFTLSLYSHAAVKVYFSDLSGNDATGNGSFAAPYKSLAKLNTFIETLQNGDSVFFKRGERYFGKVKTVNFQWAKVVITAYGVGADPVFTGFVNLTVWENMGGNIYRSDVPYITNGNLQMVRINGVTTPMGRYPDADAPNGGFLTYESTLSPNDGERIGNVVSSSLVGQPNWVGAEIAVRKSQWVIDRAIVTGQTENMILFNDPSGQDATNYFGFFFQNDLKTLNRQNEWAYRDGSFYLYTTGSPTALDVRVAVFDTLFNAELKIGYDIQHITFEGSNSITVSFTNTPGLNFQYNTVRHSGLDGVRAIGGDSIRAQFNNIFDAGNAGWYSIAYRTLFQHNDVFNCGTVQGMGRSHNQAMIGALCYGDSAKVWDNKVARIGYFGVGFGGNNTTVMRNSIDSTCMSVSDGGGIYSSGGENEVGKVLEGNTISNTIGNSYGTNQPNQKVFGMGIYLDDRSRHVKIRKNIIFNVNDYGIYLHNAQDIEVTGNTIYNASFGVAMVHDILEPDMPIRDIVMRNNYIYQPSDHPYALRLFSRIENDIASYGIIENNIYNVSNPIFQIAVNPQINPAVDLGLSAWKSTYVFDQASIVKDATATAASISVVTNPASTIRVVAVDRILSDADGIQYPFTVAIPPYGCKVLTQGPERSKRTSPGILINLKYLRF